MNVFPEIYPQRFALFGDAGFTLHRTGKPTQIMPEDRAPNLQERELDNVFIRNQTNENRFQKFLSRLFGKPKGLVGYVSTAKNTLSLDTISSPSDHIPVFLQIKDKGVIDSLLSNLKKHLGVDKAAKELSAIEQEIKKYNYTERNSFQDRLIKAELLYAIDRNNYEHDEESLKRLHELSKQLIDFKRNHLSGDSLSPRKTKMLERIRNMRDIIAQETQKKV